MTAEAELTWSVLGIFLEESGSDQGTAEVKQRTLEIREISRKTHPRASNPVVYKPTALGQSRCRPGVPGSASRPPLIRGAQEPSESRAAGAGRAGHSAHAQGVVPPGRLER